MNEWQPNLTHVVFKCGSFVPGRRRGHEKADGILLFCWAADCKGQFKQCWLVLFMLKVLLLVPCSRVPDDSGANAQRLKNQPHLTYALIITPTYPKYVCGGWGSLRHTLV